MVSAGDYKPPQQAHDVFAHFGELLDSQFTALQKVLDDDLDEFQNLLVELEVPAIVFQNLLAELEVPAIVPKA